MKNTRVVPALIGNRVSWLIAILVVLLSAGQSFGQITLEWDFDHGALDAAQTTITPTLITLGPRRDIYISRWIYCKATGVQGLNPTFRIPNDHVAGYSLGDGHRYVYSYDQQTWHFFDNGENDAGYYSFSNNAPFTQDTMWFAYGLPYPWEATEQHMATVSTSPYVSPTPSADANFILGYSNDGTLTDLGRAVPQLPMYGYLISDASAPGPKSVVVLTTGNHPNENTGHITFEGMIEFILSADPRADALRQVADFYVYPNCNPDGKWAGHARSNPENPNIDHNRDWDDPVLYTDLTVLTAAMKADTNSSADYFIDFHSFNNTTDISIWIYAEHENTPFVQALVTREPTMNLLYGSSPPDGPGVARHWAHSAAGLNAEYTFTPESGFIPGWQASRFIEQGHNYGLALYDALTAETCDYVSTNGVLVFKDDFDAGTSGFIWELYTSSSDYTADFAFDYGVSGIPPAPNSAGAETIGARFTVNNNDAITGTEALSAYPIGFEVGDDFSLRFDVWLNYNGGAGGGSGSTEFMIAGINHGGSEVIWPNNPASDGVSFAVTGEGGAAEDYRAYNGDTQYSSASGVYAAGSLAHQNSFYQSLFPSPPFETAGAPGKQWVEVEIRQQQNSIEWRLDGAIIAVVPGAAPSPGNIMIGYMDIFASVANPAADNFIIYDNVRVVQFFENDCNSNGVPDECEVDTDADQVIDECDGCPIDPQKTEPGLCGCSDSPANCNDEDQCTVDSCVEGVGCTNDEFGTPANPFDFTQIEPCILGPAGGIGEPFCDCFDFDLSGTVDLWDFAELQIDIGSN
ncbi:MAG: hypothetical protein DHS20C16_15140 [Phycisphaerae bacterium]|nr:MAG: hypothetical protein DHS20C16_15140 [Phycisphaerae bacterium]